MSQVCKSCGVAQIDLSLRTFKNGSQHLEARCLACGAFNGFVPQDISPAGFVLPFGKHRGRTLLAVFKTDPSYLDWCRLNLSSKNVKRRIDDFFASLVQEKIRI